MLHKLFHWFYCLDLHDAVILVAVCALAYLLAMEAVRKRRIKYTVHFLLLCAWTAVVLYMTIGTREVGSIRQLTVIPFYSYSVFVNGGNREIFRTNLMNVLLFVPGGLLGCILLPEKWKIRVKILLVFAAFSAMSIGIEWGQYCGALGTSEMDDVIHNTLGALAGALATVTFQHWEKEIRRD